MLCNVGNQSSRIHSSESRIFQSILIWRPWFRIYVKIIKRNAIKAVGQSDRYSRSQSKIIQKIIAEAVQSNNGRSYPDPQNGIEKYSRIATSDPNQPWSSHSVTRLKIKALPGLNLLICAEMRSVALILVPSIASAENQHDSPLKALLLCSASLITLIEWTPTCIISSSTDP